MPCDGTGAPGGATGLGVAGDRVAVIVGASGAIGGALATRVTGLGFAATHALGRATPAIAGAAVGVLDLTDEASIAAAAARAAADGPIGLVLVATGVLHARGMIPERSYRALDAAALARLFAINTIGPALVAKHFLPHVPRAGRAIFAALSARVGSIGDNRLGGWHGYRASKAALNMLIANLGIELGRTHGEMIVAGLHPGTVDSPLSAPFQRGVPPEKLFDADRSAAALLGVLAELTQADSGGCFAWDGTRIAP